MTDRRYTPHTLGYVLRAGDDIVTLADPEPVQTEALQGWNTYVLDFTPFENMTLNTGADIRFLITDEDAGNRKRQFTGFLDSIDAESEPWRLRMRATGMLERLRRVRQGGALDLSGMTDGQAVKEILQYCEIPVSNPDIADAGYKLGQQVKIKWRNQESGLDMLQKIDEVFGASTIELGNGRVARVFYDLAPKSGAVRKLYVAGQNADLFRMARNRGGVAQIQNAVSVYGVEFKKEGSKGCLYTPYAKAATNLPRLGGGKVARQEFRSDIIQDKRLAKQVARRMMRWYNREPDELIIETLNDPSVSVGTVIAARDGTYGMKLNSAQRYTVVNITRTGQFMVLNCIGGDPGNVGSINAGYEKVCNKTLTEDPDPIADPLEIPDTPLVETDLAPWPEPTPLPSVETELPTAELDTELPEPCDPPCECSPSVDFTEGMQADATLGIRISGSLTLTSATPFEVGFTGADGEYRLIVDPSFTEYAAEIRGPTGTEFATCGNAPIALGVETPYYFCWDAAGRSLVGAVGEH